MYSENNLLVQKYELIIVLKLDLKIKKTSVNKIFSRDANFTKEIFADAIL